MGTTTHFVSKERFEKKVVMVIGHLCKHALSVHVLGLVYDKHKNIGTATHFLADERFKKEVVMVIWSLRSVDMLSVYDFELVYDNTKMMGGGLSLISQPMRDIRTRWSWSLVTNVNMPLVCMSMGWYTINTNRIGNTHVRTLNKINEEHELKTRPSS